MSTPSHSDLERYVDRASLKYRCITRCVLGTVLGIGTVFLFATGHDGAGIVVFAPLLFTMLTVDF
jgi:hypothetical protein